MKGPNMKRIFAPMMMLGLLLVGAVGCAEKTSTIEETKVSTPGGTTTVTVEKEVTKTGENPPAAKP
jgi:hypothetical protein